MSDTIPDGGAFDDDADDTAFVDKAALKAESMSTVTNDAVAGETVLPQAGDGYGGPTGGSPREGEPILDEHDASDGDIVGLDDESSDEVASEDS
ncbi:hypothetical protein [Naasia lichenicola]|uniref:Uncharacterized protein n=1 Tax=Naasia lichenicola TaxID=2565933 RepID=A0A4S4FTA0_9MICO|nr:hypothetical protein [Naasia lichenicola]THG33162.1 hypothetical protein E6C64_02050 [Naasia lichenicola]